MKKLATSLVCTALLGAFLSIAGPASPAAAATTKVVRYGPYTIPAASDTGPGMIHNAIRPLVQKPCAECYITSFTPDLVYEDGSRATMDNGAMLHHAVFASAFRRDATCGGTWLGLLGQRFFATGNERTVGALPESYGYRVHWYDWWNLLADLMNMDSTSKTVYVQVTYTYRQAWEPVKEVTPAWLDIDQCGDSMYSIPAGVSDTHWDWNVNVPGNVVAMIGHVHKYGVSVEATNESLGGQSLCKSTATPDAMTGEIMNMSTCSGTPLGVVQQGQTVRLHSTYDSPAPQNDVMGIMLGYVSSS
jgi:hypothetical protein